MVVKRKSIRLLSTWILAAALLSAIGAEARASAGQRTWGRPSLTSRDQSLKPLPRPMNGEPDAPGRFLPGLPPPGTATLSWGLRIRLSMRVLLYYLPKRLP